MPTILQCKPDEEQMFERQHQKEARLSKQVKNDKHCAQVKRNREIAHAKGMLERAQDPPQRKRLRQRIDKLEAENKEERRFE